MSSVKMTAISFRGEECEELKNFHPPMGVQYTISCQRPEKQLIECIKLVGRRWKILTTVHIYSAVYFQMILWHQI